MHTGWRPLRTASALASLLHLLVSTCGPPLLHMAPRQQQVTKGEVVYEADQGLPRSVTQAPSGMVPARQCYCPQLLGKFSQAPGKRGHPGC